MCIDFKGTLASLRLAKPTPEQIQTWKLEYGDTPVEIYEVVVSGYGSVLTLPGRNALNEFLDKIAEANN